MKRSPRQTGQTPNAELHRCRAGRFCEHTQAGAWNRCVDSVCPHLRSSTVQRSVTLVEWSEDRI